MKERIILEGNTVKQWYINVNNIKIIKEKIPETFKELKELCKQTKHYAIDINNGGGLFFDDSIYLSSLTFKDNGEIDDYENYTIVKNRTPAQMWNIIKNLIRKK